MVEKTNKLEALGFCLGLILVVGGFFCAALALKVLL